MPSEIFNAIFRTLVGYFMVLVLTRFMGRKVISQMTFFDFIIGITLGALLASVSVGPARTSYSAITAIIVLSLIGMLIGFIDIKSFNIRKLVNSEPVTLIENGKIVDKNMQKVRLTIDDLMGLLREKNVFNPIDVEFAIMESDGILSVLPKSQKQPLTPSDLNIPTNYKGLTKDIIIDGNIMHENLGDAHLNDQWLTAELTKLGIHDARTVFYAGLDTSGSLYVSQKSRDHEEEHGKYGIE